MIIYRCPHLLCGKVLRARQAYPAPVISPDNMRGVVFEHEDSKCIAKYGYKDPDGVRYEPENAVPYAIVLLSVYCDWCGRVAQSIEPCVHFLSDPTHGFPATWLAAWKKEVTFRSDDRSIVNERFTTHEFCSREHAREALGKYYFEQLHSFLERTNPR